MSRRRDELEADFKKYQVRTAGIVTTLDGCYGLVRTGLRAASWVLCMFFAWKMTQELAGKDTKFTALVNVFFSITSDRWVAYSVSALASLAWWRERKLRHKTIDDLSNHIKELESRVDPQRSSSGLTNKGTPPKEERDAD